MNLSRFERKILGAMLLVALAPLVGALLLGRELTEMVALRHSPRGSDSGPAIGAITRFEWASTRLFNEVARRAAGDAPNGHQSAESDHGNRIP